MVENNQKIWKTFLRKHWQMVAVFIIIAVIAFIGAIYVFLWHVAEAQSTGLVPATLNLWAVKHIVFFLLYLLLWEFLIIGIPVLLIIGAMYFLWWKKFPDEEREEYKCKHLFGKRSRKSESGGGISLLINVFFILKVYIDGKWSVPISNWKFDYLVYSYLTALMWVLIVFGIPILIGGSLWIIHEMKKET